MTIIQAIDVRAIAIERASTLTTAYGPRNDATTILVQMSTNDGLAGLGQAAVDQPYYGESAAGMLANIKKHLVPVLIGENPLDISRLAQLLVRTLPGHEASHSALEMALWDIKGKALGVPVYQLLGGKFRDGIPVMGSLAHEEPQSMAAAAVETLDRIPYTIIKIKVGMGIDDDLRRYTAVRDAVGDRAALQVDANADYSYGDAILAISRMIEVGNLIMVDQPVARTDDMVALARKLPVPFMADEAIGGPGDALDIIARRAASAGFLKIAKHGGMLNVQKIATLFEAAGMPVSMGICYDVIAAAAAHLAAALPAVSWPSAFTDLKDTILTDPLVPDGLLFSVPGGIGLGVELDPEQVEKLTVLK